MVINAPAFVFADVMQGVELVKRPRGCRKKFKERELWDIVTAFDIETTTLHFPPEEGEAHNDHAFMYIWQWQFGPGVTVVGRTWEQFLTVCHQIEAYNKKTELEQGLKEPPLLVGYVHNLAFEWQFLAGIYPFRDEEVFFAKRRKPLYCRMFDSLELRCSFKLANMTLAKFAQTMGCAVRKQSGQKFDYNKIRYADTELTRDELEYCIDDVISLEEAVRIKMQRDGDTLRTIPLTATGYVRRECKEALSGIRKSIIEPMLPTEAQYRMLRAAFRGGNTHANALGGMVGKVLENVESYDMSSCYPAQQLTKLFPMKPFRMLKPQPTMDRILWWIGRNYAVVGEYVFGNLRLKDFSEPVPYISLAKTKSAATYIAPDGTETEIGLECDNGRLIRAGLSVMTITEIDLKIIADTYTWDYVYCTRAMVASKEPLPREYRAVIQRFYDYKTSMKAAAATDEDIAYQYGKSKNLLNGIYGMSAQDPIHQLIELVLEDADNFGGEFHISDYDSDGAKNALFRANFPYQWGVYTTAYAREALQEGITAAGKQMVYCDTDSVKTLGHVDFTAINAARQALADEWKAHCADAKGVEHYVGVFESEGTYDTFITQGAKRYAYMKHGEMGITVSGVTHRKHEYYNDRGELVKAVPYCNEELGSLDRFAPGMTWVEAGGTASVYNDLDDFVYNAPDGHSVHITRNVAIVNTTYTLSYAKDYAQLLETIADAKLYAEWRKERE